MNDFDNMTSKRSGSKVIRRAALLLVLFVSVVLVVTLVFMLFAANKSSAPSSIANTDIPTTDGDSLPDKVAEPSPMTPPAKGTVITTGDSDFGTMLFNEKKQAIYIWELEESLTPECYGDCANAWPPVLTDGKPQATGDVNSTLLGTTKRTDGSVQVTYNGHPLYYYAHEGPGEVECHNIRTHGGLWWVIQPDGKRAK